MTRRIFLALTVVLTGAAVAPAQQYSPQPTDPEALLEKMAQRLDQIIQTIPRSDPNAVTQTTQQVDLLTKDPELAAAYKQYMLAHFKDEQKKMEDQRRIIASTNRMGICVFVVVHAFLVFAAYVAFREFREASKTRGSKRQNEEIELSFQKIALKTSMHGTILLVISLALYFLFLRFVYTITLID